MIEEQIINIESQEVIEEIMDSEPLPVKTSKQRREDAERLHYIKKMIKQKRRYYKSNLFAIRSMNAQ
jgi:hypothetical protein